MVFRMLEIDWTTLIDNGELLWTGIAAMGGTTLMSIFTFVKTTVSATKFTKVSDFAVVADKSIKYAKTELADLKSEVVTEVKKEIVAPLVEQITTLKEDNTKLANLAVSLISLTPIPVEQKKAILPVLSAIGTVTQEAIQVLQANITQEELKALEEVTTNDNLTESANAI